MFRDRPVEDSAAKHYSDPPLGFCYADERSSGSPLVPSASLELPPILAGPIPAASVPNFPTIPPLSTIKSIAGSGCTCGFKCTCPGCVEHRTLRYAEKHHKDCSEGCSHCVDQTAGIELPDQNASPHCGNLVDIFFARAAALPNPPLNRRTELDPPAGDITAYPCERCAGSSTEADGRDVVIRVPKVEYTSADVCQSRRSCGGRCDDDPVVTRDM